MTIRPKKKDELAIPSHPVRRRWSLGPGWISAGYVGVAALWILTSDRLVVTLWRDPRQIEIASTLKGWGFVGVTAVLLYGLFNRHLNQIAGRERAIQAEQAEKIRSLALMRDIAESSTDAIFVKDQDGRYIFVNTAAAENLGRSAAEIIGRDDTALFPPAEAAAIMAEDRRVIESGRIQSCEETLTLVTGVRTMLAIKGPMLDPSSGKVGSFGIARDITDRKAAESQIQFLAYHDSLTRLPNRLMAEDRMRLAMSRASRLRGKAALLFVDLDRFKAINDTLGHTMGDELLVRVAERLRSAVRDTDTVCRHGGDEFLVVLSDVADETAIANVAEKVLLRVSEDFGIDGHTICTSVSIGVAVYPDDGGDFAVLLRKADTAMYYAKDAGRNICRFYNQEMHNGAEEYLLMRNALRLALERNEFVLHYQPQIEIKSRKVIGAEALIRWRRSERDLVYPDHFIPAAEDTGLIVPIGEWALREASRQMATWEAEGLGDFTVAVNLSAVQFKRGDLERAVGALLKGRNDSAASDWLELELTESILIDNAEAVLATIGNLKTLGVRLSIDDFGTGYSSLAYLKRFKVDKLKIDRSFVCDMLVDADDAAIVRTIIQMAKSLGLRTIAEGVEDEPIFHELRALGCDEVQGYLFSHPLPAAEFAAYVRHSNG